MRETRLLILVVVVSVAVLLLLARLRFPDTALSSVTPSAGPLGGLAARATFDEMAETMAGLLGQVGPTIALVRFEPIPVVAAPGASAAAPATPARSRAGAPPSTLPPPLTAAAIVRAGIRVQSDLALVYVPPGYRPISAPDLAEPLEVVASDTVRNLALVRAVPSPVSLDGLPASVQNIGGLSYVGVVRPALNGPTIAPVFLGRTDPYPAAEWTRPVAALGPDPNLSPGTLVFALDGRFMGLIVSLGDGIADGIAIVPADALQTFVKEMLAARSGAR